jgi:hypothetical protein
MKYFLLLLFSIGCTPFNVMTNEQIIVEASICEKAGMDYLIIRNYNQEVLRVTCDKPKK